MRGFRGKEGEGFQRFAEAVRDHVAAASVKPMDETGFRIGGKTQWVHMASTTLLTFCRVSAKRGSLSVNVVGVSWWALWCTTTGIHATR